MDKTKSNGGHFPLKCTEYNNRYLPMIWLEILSAHTQS